MSINCNLAYITNKTKKVVASVKAFTLIKLSHCCPGMVQYNTKLRKFQE